MASPKPAEEDTSDTDANTAESKTTDDSNARPESTQGEPDTFLQLAERRLPAQVPQILYINSCHEIEKTGILADVRCP